MVYNRRVLAIGVLGWLLPAAPLWAFNMLDVEKGQIQFTGEFDVWALSGLDWREFPVSDSGMKLVLQPAAVYGFNTVCVHLQVGEPHKGFFTPDGAPRDAHEAERLSKLLRAVFNHHMAVVVNPFNSDPRWHLGNEAAYRKALETLVDLQPKYHSAILVLGDAFSNPSGVNPAEFPLADSQRLVALAERMLEMRSDCRIGLPARMVNDDASDDLLYVVDNAESAMAFIRELEAGTPVSDRTSNVAVIRADRFLDVPNISDLQTGWLDPRGERIRDQRLAMAADPLCDPDSPKATLSREETAEGFELLFDGRSLDGWTGLSSDWDAWEISNSAIHTKGVGGTWLRSRESFDDFVLRLQFKIEKGGNSGVFFRAPIDGRASRFGYECQIFGREADDPDARSTTGAIYGVIAPTIDAGKPPGQWNDLEIACIGQRISVRVNGQRVLDFNAEENPRTKTNLTKGIIGLQDHDNEVWFRNIRVKRLAKDANKATACTENRD